MNKSAVVVTNGNIVNNNITNMLCQLTFCANKFVYNEMRAKSIVTGKPLFLFKYF